MKQKLLVSSTTEKKEQTESVHVGYEDILKLSYCFEFCSGIIKLLFDG